MEERKDGLAAYVNRSVQHKRRRGHQPVLVFSDKQAAKIARRKARMG